MFSPRDRQVGDENAVSPVAAYYHCGEGGGHSDWGSPTGGSAHHSAPSPFGAHRTVNTQQQLYHGVTPPPLPKLDGSIGRPDWSKVSDLSGGGAEQQLPRGFSEASSAAAPTPLPQRRSGFGAPSATSPQQHQHQRQQYDLPPRYTPGQQQQAVDDTLTMDDWEQQHGAYDDQHERLPIYSSPKPRTLADVQGLPPPSEEYDEFGRKVADEVYGTPKVIGFRPPRSSRPTQLPPSQQHDTSATNSSGARRRAAALLQLASPTGIAIDNLMDRMAEREPIPMYQLQHHNHNHHNGSLSPKSTDLDASTPSREDVMAATRAVVMMDAADDDGPPRDLSPVRPRNPTRRRRVMAMIGVAGLASCAGVLITLGSLGILG